MAPIVVVLVAAVAYRWRSFWAFHVINSILTVLRLRADIYRLDELTGDRECGIQYGSHERRVCRRPHQHEGRHEMRRTFHEWLYQKNMELFYYWNEEPGHWCDKMKCCRVCGRHVRPHRGCYLR